MVCLLQQTNIASGTNYANIKSSKCDLFYSYQEKGSGLVIENLHFKAGDSGSIPSQGTKLQLSPWGETKEKTVTHNKRKKKIPHATIKIPCSQKEISEWMDKYKFFFKRK